MRAVWSFRSKPFQAYKANVWLRPLHHLLAWGISLQAARRHYPDTVLITDRAGKRLLVDQLGLSFRDVSTELERLREVDVGGWALGKLVAYGVQDKPFVHMDSDVFLWKPLPGHLHQAAVFAQCPETFHSVNEPFNPRDIEQAFAENGLALPIEWQWYRSREKHAFREENCGILGGNDLDFLRYYSSAAIDLVTRPQNASAWSRFPEKECFNMIVEQFFLTACLDFIASIPCHHSKMCEQAISSRHGRMRLTRVGPHAWGICIYWPAQSPTPVSPDVWKSASAATIPPTSDAARKCCLCKSLIPT
jgi:hypothetical protein